MCKLVIMTAVAASVYGLGTAAASAACTSGSFDGSNRIVVEDLDCQGIDMPGTKVWTEGAPRKKTQARLEAEARVAGKLEAALRANPPEGTNPSFVTWLVDAMFGNRERIETTLKRPDVKDHATRDSARRKDTVTAKRVLQTGPANKTATSTPGLNNGPFCMVDISGKGRQKTIGLWVASAQTLKATAQATVVVAGRNHSTFDSDLPLDLKADKADTFAIATTTVANGDVVAATLQINGHSVTCN